MRLSEIGDKEIIDIRHGTKHGELWDAELLFDPETGMIKAILIPELNKKSRFFSGNVEFQQLPWDCILKIGEDLIIFQSPQ